MIDNVTLQLDSPATPRGETITGTISFECPSQYRWLSDFAISVILQADLHTSIPASSGLLKHANQVVYSSSSLVLNKSASKPSTIFTIPFSHKVSETCPLSMVHRTIAKLQHSLTVKISDLTAAFAQPITTREYLQITPSLRRPISLPQVRRHKKINYTVNPILVPGASFFTQFEYPEYLTIETYRMSLLTELNITGKHSFSRKTEREFRDPTVISRRSPNGSNVAILEAKIPVELGCSVNVSGLVRKYKVSVVLEVLKKSSINLTFDVEVVSAAVPTPPIHSVPESTMSASLLHPIGQSITRPTVTTETSISRPASTQQQTRIDRPLSITSNPTTPLRPIRAAPIAPLPVPQKSPLRNLSMSQLSSKASSPLSSSSPINHSAPASPSSSVTDSLSEHDQFSARSAGSSISSNSQASSPSCTFHETPFYFPSPSPTASCSLPVDSAWTVKGNGHAKTNSTSTTTSPKRASKRFSLSISKLSRPFGSSSNAPKDMEFSCCGKKEVDDEDESVGTGAYSPSPSLCLSASSCPSSPSSVSSSSSLGGSTGGSTGKKERTTTTTMVTRRLSFKRGSTQSSTSKSIPQSLRSSISEEYLTHTGFQFDGIKSLDHPHSSSSQNRYHGFEPYRFEEDEVIVTLGVAL